MKWAPFFSPSFGTFPSFASYLHHQTLPVFLQDSIFNASTEHLQVIVILNR